jgi:hypothetical protein
MFSVGTTLNNLLSHIFKRDRNHQPKHLGTAVGNTRHNNQPNRYTHARVSGKEGVHIYSAMVELDKET